MDTIRETIFALKNFSFPGRIREVKKDGVYVKIDGENATVGFTRKIEKARAYFLLMTKFLAGERKTEFLEKARFDLIGPMLDVSFGRVLRVGAVKDLIVRFAAMGLNMLMLYTEDTYELEGYPFFGYLRGRYSIEELREIDDFAFSMGVEVVPCIQTFGHLSKYLRWKEAKPIADTATVLLADEEKTYAFIEAEIATMKKAFRSDRIHLGMDETKDLGLGKYLALHGYHEKPEIFRRHLARVLDIAKKYYREPMIWSDMLFAEPGYGDYDLRFELPQSRIDQTPKGVDLVFWNYYNDTVDFYDQILTRHERFPNRTAFAGAVWTWDGLAPNFDYTLKTMRPAMLAALKHRLKTVIATTWISVGGGADFFHALGGFAVFSEYCWKGEACADKDIYDMSETIGGVDETLFHAISESSLGFKGAVSLSKAYFYGDPLIDLSRNDFSPVEAAKRWKKAKRTIDRYPDFAYHDYFSEFFACLAGKAQLIADLRAAYASNDKAKLDLLARRAIPRLLRHFEAFHGLFCENWKKTAKPFGMEAFSADFGGVMQRLKDAKEIVSDYASGKIDRIEELDEAILPGVNKTWQSPHSYMSINW